MKRITLRLPDDLHRAISEFAKNESRSLNEQIVYGLHEYAKMVERIKKSDKAFAEMNDGNYYVLVEAEEWDKLKKMENRIG